MADQTMETESFLDELKRELDRELPPEEMAELIHLVKDKLDYHFDCDLPSDLVTFLENNMKRSKVISVLKHALAVMKFHGRFGSRYLAGWIGSYQKSHGQLDDENFLIHLVKDKLDYHFECDLPSDLVTFLENNMKRSKVISVLKHALAVMKFHGRFGSRYLAGWIGSYQKSHGQLDDENFVGRRGDIEKLCDILNTAGFLGVWIYGFGGLGKTTIAKEIGSRMMRVRGIDFLTVDLKQADTTSDMYRSILRQLHQLSHETDRVALQTRARTVILQDTQKETWILLDNIEEIYSQHNEEIDSFLKSLHGEAHCNKVKFLVTSRINVDHDHDDTMYQYKLGPLDDEASLRFLRSSCRPAVLQEIQYSRAIEYCGNIPLALVLFSNTVSQRTSMGIPMTDLNLNTIANGQAQLQDCIRYSFERLSDDLKNWLILLSTFGRSRFNAASVCRVLDISKEEAVCALMQLCHLDMVQKAEGQTENVAFLVAESEQAEEDEHDDGTLCYTYFFHELLLRFLQLETDRWFNAQPCPSPEPTGVGHSCALTHRNRLSEEEFRRCEERFSVLILRGLGRCFADFYGNSRASIQHISDNAHLLRKFFSTLSPKVLQTVSLTECEHLQMVATHVMATDVEKQETLTKIHDISDRLECRYFWKIREVAYCIERGSWNEAEAILSRLENDPLFQGLPAQSQRVLKANLLYQKGRLSRKKKAYLEAKTHLRLALDIFEQEGSRDPEIVSTHADVLNSLGNVAYNLTEYDRSLEYHKQAVEVMKVIVGDSIHHQMSMFKFNIGTIALAKARQIKQVVAPVPLSTDDVRRVGELMELCLSKMDDSIEDDIKLGLHGLSDFADKLQHRSDARLDVKDFAGSLADAEECLRIREKNLLGKNAKRMLTNYKIGRIYLKQRKHATSSEDKRALLVKARDKFNLVIVNILDGDLTRESEGITWFLIDLKRLAEATLDKAYMAQVDKLCTRVHAGENPDSSSDSTSVEEPESASTSSDSDTNDRKDSGVQMEDSQDTSDTGDTEMSDASIPENNGMSEAQASFQRMFSDEVFYSGDDELELSDIDQTLIQKRKRESDSD